MGTSIFLLLQLVGLFGTVKVDGQIQGRLVLERVDGRIEVRSRTMPDTMEVARDATAEIVVECSQTGAQPVDCSSLLVQLKSAPDRPAASVAEALRQPDSLRVTFPGTHLIQGSNGSLGVLTRNGATIISFTVRNPADAGGGSQEQSTAAAIVPIQDLLTRDCFTDQTGRERLAAWLRDPQNDPPTYYAAEQNVARFLVTPLGNVIVRPPAKIDENDLISVSVLADPRLTSRLLVARSSTIRDVTQVSLVGGGLTIDAGLIRQDRDTDTTVALPPPACTISAYTLLDFAPGEGKVTLTALDASGAELARSFSFVVNRLYAGALSLGGLWSTIEDRSFQVATADDKSIAAYDRNSEGQMQYTLLLTPFIWGKRDIEKPRTGLIGTLSHVNPSFGLVLGDITDNVVGGVTIDLLNSFYFTFGSHLGQVQELTGGVAVGDEFGGQSDDLPVTTRWTAKNFAAVTVDLRAAVQLVGTALSAAATGR